VNGSPDVVGVGRRALRQAQDIRSETENLKPIRHTYNRISDSNITFDLRPSTLKFFLIPCGAIGDGALPYSF
jgi:hypothetical protein